jgi:anti-sigma factor RsiW
MTDRELNCQELVELITEYLEGVLSAEERARFEAHLASCRGCRNYLEQMRQTIHLVGSLSEQSLSPAARNELLDLFHDWKQNSQTQQHDHTSDE